MKERFRNLVVATLVCIVNPIEAIAENSFRLIHETNSSEKIQQFGFSKEGDYFYALKSNGAAQVLKTSNRKSLKTKMSDVSSSEIMWTNDPLRIYLTRPHQPVQMFNLQTLKSQTVSFNNPGRGPSIISSDGRFLMKGTEIYDFQRRSNYLIRGLDYNVYQYSRWLSMSDDFNTVQMSTSDEKGDSAAVLTYIDLEMGYKLASWTPNWLLDGNIIESVLMRGKIAAIGMDNKKIKLWSYVDNETVRSLPFEEDITFLKRDQGKDSERLIAWGDTSISIWESADWKNNIEKKTLKHGSPKKIRKPSLSYDSQFIAFTGSENKVQLRSMEKTIAQPVEKEVGKSLRQLKGRLKGKIQEESLDESMALEAENNIVLNEFNDELDNQIQAIFSPTENYLLTLNESRNKLTLWQFE